MFADVNQIRAVFRNAIGNAIKFTEFGGRIELNAEINEDTVTIAIKDNGVGKNKEKVDSLYLLQTNSSSEGTAGEKGVGLGTSVIKEFVEKNGGKVWVESELGAGTTLFFTVPKV